MFQLEEDELSHVPILVFANKQDLPGAVPASNITEALRLRGRSPPVGVLWRSCVSTIQDQLSSDMGPHNWSWLVYLFVYLIDLTPQCAVKIPEQLINRTMEKDASAIGCKDEVKHSPKLRSAPDFNTV